MRPSPGSLALAGALSLVAAARVVFTAESRSPASATSRTSHETLVSEYCVSCHDADKKKGGLALDAIAVDDVARHPAVWEKVVRKLRARQMPPVGQERPDEKTYDAVIASLEARLDRAAALRPDPGPTPS